MATKYILDTSVVVKWFFRQKEPDLEKAKSIYDDIQNRKIDCFTFDFLFAELINVFLCSKKSDARTAIQACHLLLKSNIHFLPLANNYFFSAALFAEKNHLTIYDSLFLVLAKDKNCKVLTADTKMAKENLSLFVSDYK